MESVKNSGPAGRSRVVKADKKIRGQRLLTALIAAGVCFFMTAIFIGIGIEIPWAFLPATGIASMIAGYQWGISDNRSVRQRKLSLRRKKECRAAVSGYAAGPVISGDSCSWETMHDGKFAAALSDGMGKGAAAAEESSLAVKIITKMLQAGLGPETALKLLNMTFMIRGGRDCYSTMDLAVLDPSGRELRIYKIGAAATVIRRTTGRTDVLSAPAMPMGVMELEHIPYVSTMVTSGDQIIMMTDGIAESARDDLEMKWLQQLLNRIKSRNLQTVCDLIVQQAAANYGCLEKDDMTVMAFTVK